MRAVVNFAESKQQFPIYKSTRVRSTLGEDVGSREHCRQAPMGGFTELLDRHTSHSKSADKCSSRELLASKIAYSTRLANAIKLCTKQLVYSN
ncbi:MAG TPA: hypothetical protein DCZ48_02125 [Methylococcaceae bacterium]|nr:hypothetical protein [Methylococcaceae bacterium]